MVDGILADDQVTDIQVGAQRAGDAGIDDMGHVVEIDEDLGADGGIDLTHTALHHHRRAALQATLIIRRACVDSHGDLFHFFLQGSHFHIHGADNSKLHKDLQSIIF